MGKKIHFYIGFCLCVAVSACVSTKPKVDEAANPWFDADDYVEYVNLHSRKPSSAPSRYNLIGTCPDGFPQVDVRTAPGFCLSLISESSEFKKPRTSEVLSENEILIADMGSWNPFDGKILSLSFDLKGNSHVKVLLSSKSFSAQDSRRAIIDRPHQIKVGPDGLYYVGTATSLLRFNPKSADIIKSIEMLVPSMPALGLHPLKAFTFGNQNDIYINVGSATNVCQKFGIQGAKKSFCEEAENEKMGQAQIRRYFFDSNRKIIPKFEIYAKGLRNSIALTWDEKHKVLLQGENGRDAIEKFNSTLNTKQLPHEEINIIQKGHHYGWPYCYDDGKNNPEWTNIDCSKFDKPKVLLPAHSAPLAMHIYSGMQFPAWYQNRLLINLHGYETKGHRLVAMKRDDNGLPTGTPLSIIYGWDKKGDQMQGNPVGLTQLPDGSLILIEDNSKKVLHLSYSADLGDGQPVQEIDLDESSNTDPNDDPVAVAKRKADLDKRLSLPIPPSFSLFQSKVIDKTCSACHGVEGAPGVLLLKYDDLGNALRIRNSGKASEIYEMLKGNPQYPTMPPQGFDSEQEQKMAAELFNKWLNGK